ncbi:MAG: hypothetical protein JXA04_10415 [Gammaproteobacteria bacterium]|nr:hypothetical protein [Gammaproteobacteria bacterium]
MSKEATNRIKDKFAQTPASPKNAMQCYLRYLKSDLKPVPEEEQYPVRSFLDVWQDHQTS